MIREALALLGWEPYSFEGQLDLIFEITNNNVKFAKWLLQSKGGRAYLAKYGITQDPQSIKHGGQGVAAIYSRLVAKVTSNEAEANLAERLAQDPCPGVPKIISVSKPTNVGGFVFWIIIMSRERSYASRHQKIAGEFVANYLDNNLGDLKELDNLELAGRIVSIMPPDHHEDSVFRAVFDLIQVLKGVLTKTGFALYDTHAGNLGQVDGNLGILDIGAGEQLS